MVKPTILVIDKDSELRERIAEILKLAGYSILHGENGVKGLELIERHTPDLVFCGVVMPELDGFGVLRAIQNIPSMINVPFVFLTAKATDGDLRKGMNLGADDYLIQPFNNGDLLEIINARLKKSGRIKQKIEDGNNSKNHIIKDTKNFNDIFFTSQYKINRKVKLGQVLYMEGDSVNFIFCLAAGKVKTYRTNEAGKDIITGLFKKGDIFGHASFYEGNQRESCAAIEHSEFISIPREDFLQMLDSNNAVSRKLTMAISDNFLEAGDKMLKLAYNSTSQKVADALLYYDKKYKETGHDSFPFDRTNISALAGVAKESVSRTLTDFTNKGLITIDAKSGHITIQNQGILKNLQP